MHRSCWPKASVVELDQTWPTLRTNTNHWLLSALVATTAKHLFRFSKSMLTFASYWNQNQITYLLRPHLLSSFALPLNALYGIRVKAFKNAFEHRRSSRNPRGEGWIHDVLDRIWQTMRPSFHSIDIYHTVVKIDMVWTSLNFKNIILYNCNSLYEYVRISKHFVAPSNPPSP